MYYRHFNEASFGAYCGHPFCSSLLRANKMNEGLENYEADWGVTDRKELQGICGHRSMCGCRLDICRSCPGPNGRAGARIWDQGCLSGSPSPFRFVSEFSRQGPGTMAAGACGLGVPKQCMQLGEDCDVALAHLWNACQSGMSQ